MAIKNLLINIILFGQIQSHLYFSIFVEGVDECLYKIEEDQILHFQLPQYIHCNIYALENYPNVFFKPIMNKIYVPGKKINI